MKRENAMRGGGAAKAKDKNECENKGCIFVRKNTSLDIEASSTRINCENGRSHPLGEKGSGLDMGQHHDF